MAPMTAPKRKAPSNSAPKGSPAKKPTPAVGKSKAKPNGNILSFFKKVNSPAKATGGSSDNSIFIVDDDDDDLYRRSQDFRPTQPPPRRMSPDPVELVRLYEESQAKMAQDDDVNNDSGMDAEDGDQSRHQRLPVPQTACTPPPPAKLLKLGNAEDLSAIIGAGNNDANKQDGNGEKQERRGSNASVDVANPFILDGADEVRSSQVAEAPIPSQARDEEYIEDEAMEMLDEEQEGERSDDDYGGGIDDEDFPLDIGEELENRRHMEAQNREEEEEEENEVEEEIVCPICAASLRGLAEDDSTRHVNACLDGNPIPIPNSQPSGTIFRTPTQHAPRPPQHSPFTQSSRSTGMASAFTKIMASHAEDRAWQTAANNEEAARGKRSFKRTCPFYKILPNLNVAVDAFRYGKVDGINAYFLSHFHSDHYIGLTSSWTHGPIYCSRVTANLVRRQLRVDPKFVFELKFETLTEIPGTGGAKVTMIEANHCPGSSLFLFDKEVPGYGGGKRNQRILHCGDFRASADHLRHPLLNAFKGNKIDICYLDTTYLNPKYAFPPQQQVIDVCAELCVSLAKEIVDGADELEKKRREAGIAKFTVPTNADQEGSGKEVAAEPESPKKRGKLLVVIGTYSIGKERICMAIAKALDSKIFASQNKQRICAALEDQELNSRLTSDPLAAQVHMTPLMEIRAETLRDYLHGYRAQFSRIVGFRPSGWNYRPPAGRLTDNPAVQTVLHAEAWKSHYTINQCQASIERGSTSEAMCYKVPYSEHSSFRELTAFCCGLNIVRVIPTVNVGSATSREKMKMWIDKWAQDRRKSGYYKLEEGTNIL